MAIGIRAASTIRVDVLPVASISQPLRNRYARPPPATCRRTRGGPSPLGVHREEGDVGADASRDGRHQGIVAVEHDPAVGLRDPADRGLDLGELGQGVDALQVEVVGRHVGEDRGVVRLVAHPAQDDPAAGGLEDRDVDVGAGEDLLRAARPGPVAGIDDPLVDEDAVRGRRADVPTGLQQDVGDQPGDGRLAVRPRDRDGRHPPIGVTDPGRRRGPRPGDALGPASQEPFLGAGQLRGPSTATRRDRPGRWRPR